MNLVELARFIGINVDQWGPLIIIVLTLIDISPIPLDPCKFFFKMIGRLINKEVLDRVTNVELTINEVKYNAAMNDAITARIRILRFCDELQNSTRHSKDSYDQVMADITSYERYCFEHPEFKNNQTASTVNYIKRNYEDRLEKHDFRNN